MYGGAATALWLRTERPQNPKLATDRSALPLVRHIYHPPSGGNLEIVDWEIEKPPLQSTADVQVYVQSCISPNPALIGVKRVVKTVKYKAKEEILRELEAMFVFNGGAGTVSNQAFSNLPLKLLC